MGVIQQYEKFVKPAHEDFVKPVASPSAPSLFIRFGLCLTATNDQTMQWADLIVPKGVKNEVAINIICKHIELTLQVE